MWSLGIFWLICNFIKSMLTLRKRDFVAGISSLLKHFFLWRITAPISCLKGIFYWQSQLEFRAAKAALHLLHLPVSILLHICQRDAKLTISYISRRWVYNLYLHFLPSPCVRVSVPLPILWSSACATFPHFKPYILWEKVTKEIISLLD